jgi:hypothetical protein
MNCAAQRREGRLLVSQDKHEIRRPIDGSGVAVGTSADPMEGAGMRLFTFASKNRDNIELGIKARRWAVATVSNRAMAGRKTKAHKYMQPGDLGLLYSNVDQAFTTPFIVETAPDVHGCVADIWPEPWVIPFGIRPLGSLSLRLGHEQAKTRWPFLRGRLKPTGGVSAAMNITGATVFVPIEITAADWQIILDDLALSELLKAS